MRIFIIVSFILGYNASSAQTYSKIVSDSEIISFITHTTKAAHVKAMSSSIYPLNVNEFYYSDSADLANKSNSISNFIFKRYKTGKEITFTYHLDTIFSRQDIDFFKTQIEGLQGEKNWKREFKHTFFDDAPELNERNLTQHTIYDYSIPLFSVDKKKVIVIKHFYCGLLCGGGAYELYIKNANNKWKLVKKMYEWGE